VFSGWRLSRESVERDHCARVGGGVGGAVAHPARKFGLVGGVSTWVGGGLGVVLVVASPLKSGWRHWSQGVPPSCNDVFSR